MWKNPPPLIHKHIHVTTQRGTRNRWGKHEGRNRTPEPWALIEVVRAKGEKDGENVIKLIKVREKNDLERHKNTHTHTHINEWTKAIMIGFKGKRGSEGRYTMNNGDDKNRWASELELGTTGTENGRSAHFHKHTHTSTQIHTPRGKEPSAKRNWSGAALTVSNGTRTRQQMGKGSKQQRKKDGAIAAARICNSAHDDDDGDDEKPINSGPGEWRIEARAPKQARKSERERKR